MTQRHQYLKWLARLRRQKHRLWLTRKPAPLASVNRLLWRKSVSSLSFFVMLTLSGIISSLALCLSWAIYPASAWATTWYPVAQAGQQEQFVDLDSIEPLDQGHVRVRSYYVDRRSGTPQRTDYLTEYDCDRRRFRDVEYDGPVGSSSWMPVAPDPLNSAALAYVCGLGRG